MNPARGRSRPGGGRLSIATPAGWAFEQLILSSRDQPATLDVRTERVHPAEALGAFAQRWARTLAEHLSGFAEESGQVVGLGPHEVFVRRFTWGGEDSRREGADACRLAGDRAIVATLRAEANLAPGAEESLGGLLSELSLHDDVPEVTRTFTVEELAAVAELVGAPTYPGTGEHRLAASDERIAARRSLVARGTIGEDGEGGLAIDPLERTLLGAPLASAAVISAERRSRSTRETQIFHVTPTVTVLQARSGSGLHRLTGFPTVGLARRLREFAGLEDRDAPAGEPVKLDLAGFDRLVEEALAGRATAGDLVGPLGALRAAFTLRVLRREEGRHVGGTLRWLDAGPDGLWLVEPSADGLRVSPAASADVLERLRAEMA